MFGWRLEEMLPRGEAEGEEWLSWRQTGWREESWREAEEGRMRHSEMVSNVLLGENPYYLSSSRDIS